MVSDSEDFDNETGEKMQKGVYIKVQPLSTNAETGEPELGERILKKKFQVPLNYVETNHEKGGRKAKPRRRTIPGVYFRKKVGLNVVKELALCKRRRVSPVVFMLPTLFICPGWASILCLLGEACMHMWSHRRCCLCFKELISLKSVFVLVFTVCLTLNILILFSTVVCCFLIKYFPDFTRCNFPVLADNLEYF